jgi:hypothetical protein
MSLLRILQTEAFEVIGECRSVASVGFAERVRAALGTQPAAGYVEASPRALMRELFAELPPEQRGAFLDELAALHRAWSPGSLARDQGGT